MSTLYAKPWFMDRPTLERTRDIARVLTGHGLTLAFGLWLLWSVWRAGKK